MANPNLSELITTTARYRNKFITDNVSQSAALLTRLKTKGKMKMVDGGRDIVTELDYQENATFGWYSGYDTINITPQDVLSGANWDWKQAAISVAFSGLEAEVQNAGKEQYIDLVEGRMENAERSMMNNISAGVYSDGTGSGGKQIGGLQLLIADTNSTGSPGNISRVNYSFWRNVSYDATTDGGAAATSANIGSYMNRVWVQVVRGNDKPDLIVADNNYWRLYLESLQAIQRIGSSDVAEAGYSTLKYMNADVVLDGGYGGDAPTNHMYFINTNYIKFCTAKQRNFVMLEDKSSVNQDATVRIMVWAGALTMSNALTQGVLKD